MAIERCVVNGFTGGIQNIIDCSLVKNARENARLNAHAVEGRDASVRFDREMMRGTSHCA
jgi:hypothetical protein